MPDQTYQLLIKIQAELAQAKSSADELTRQIKLAKEAGQSYDALSKSLEVVERRMGAMQDAAKKANQALDLDRYNQSPSQFKGTRPGDLHSADDAAMRQRMDGYKKEAEARKLLSTQAAAEIAQYTQLSPATRAYIASLNDSNKAMADGADKKKLLAGRASELKKIIGQLSAEFPLAGAALRFFINPLSAALVLGTTAFVLIKRSISDLNAELDQLETDARQPLSNIAELFREAAAAAEDFHVSEEFEKFGGNVQKISTAADAAVASLNALIAAQTELQNAQAAESIAKINLAEARYKATDGKEGISPAQAIQQRQAARDFAERQKKETEDAKVQSELEIRQHEKARLQGEQAKLQKLILTPEQEEKQKSIANNLRNKTAPDLEAAAKDKKYGPDGNLVDDIGWKKFLPGQGPKTLEEKISELSTKLAKNAADRKDIENKVKGLADGKPPKVWEIPFSTLGKDLDKEQADLLTQRDALETQKARMLAQSAKAKGQAAEIDRGVTVSEKSREESKSLAEKIKTLEAQIKALEEKQTISKTTGEETEATKRRTRATESETERVKEQDEEKKRKGDKNDDEITRQGSKFRSPDSASRESSEGEFFAAADALESAVTEALIAQDKKYASKIEKVAQNLADLGSRLGDSLV